MMHTTTVEQADDGHFYITFSPEVLAELGWDEGTDVQWIDNEDGTFTLQKVPEETDPSTN